MLSGVRALVVDDNFNNRLILREMLSSRGAEVDEAEDGPPRSSISSVPGSAAFPTSSCCSTAGCPGWTDSQVAERIKAGTEQGLTVLMLSSDDLKVQLTRARELGLDAYLVKPVRRSDLFDGNRDRDGRSMRRFRPGAMNPRRPPRSLRRQGAAGNAQPDRRLSILLADDSRGQSSADPRLTSKTPAIGWTTPKTARSRSQR